jgi:hypothetical protein
MELKEYIEAVKQEESLKLEKNSKGYNWEFKLLGKVEDLINRAKEIDLNLQSKFNKQEVNQNG